jgi:hypothetical protein
MELTWTFTKERKEKSSYRIREGFIFCYIRSDAVARRLTLTLEAPSCYECLIIIIDLHSYILVTVAQARWFALINSPAYFFVQYTTTWLFFRPRISGCKFELASGSDP